VAGVCSPPCSPLADEGLSDPLLRGSAPDCVVAGVCSPPCQTPAAEVSKDEEGFTDMQISENTAAESLCTNSLPNEGLTSYAPLPPTPINDAQITLSRVKLPDDWDRKTSTLDKLLSPELVAHILRTTARV